MKNQQPTSKAFVLSMLFFVFIFSCGKKQDKSVDELLENGDIQALKTKSDQIKASADSLLNIAAKLDARVFELDEGNRDYRLVKTLEIQEREYKHYINLQANLAPDQEADVMPEYSGVINLRVREGQRVGRGATLGVIDDGGLADQLNQAKIGVTQAKAQVTQAEAQLKSAQISADLAKTTFEKRKRLWEQNIGSEIQYLSDKSNYEAAEKQVEVARQNVSVAQQQVQVAEQGVGAAQAQLNKTILRAPFSGVVDELFVKSGQVVSPSAPVIKLVNPNKILAKVAVPENYVSDIQIGTEAQIYISSLQDTLAGKVNLVGASINPANRTFEIEIPISDKRVKPNQNAEVRLNHYKNENAIVIPESSIKYDASGPYVFVVDGDIAKKVDIETGLEGNNLVEVSSGLSAGDVIVTDGVNQVQDGGKIKTSVE